MASYIMAMTINPNAKKQHPDLSRQINQSLEVFAKNKVKVLGLYATLGRFDCLAMFDVADQATAFKVASEITAKGILETETWPVIPFEDFTQLLGQ